MIDVSFLHFLNTLDPCVRCEVLSFVHEFELEELPAGVRALDLRRDLQMPRVSFAAERALLDRRNTPFFRPHYRPDLSVFDPFCDQLELFGAGPSFPSDISEYPENW